MTIRINPAKPKPPTRIDMPIQGIVSNPGHPPTDVDCSLRYDIDDPLAVTIEFRPRRQPISTWVFARNLLADGLEAPSGDGDVYIALDDDRYVTFLISSPDGTAKVVFRTAVVRAFLDRTTALLPIGDEPAPDLSGLENMLRAAETQGGEW